MSSAKKNQMRTQVVLKSLPSGCVIRSPIVGLSLCKAYLSSDTVSFVFSFVSHMLSSNRLSVWPYCFTRSFRFWNISLMLPMLFVTLLIYFVRWFILLLNCAICCDSMSSFSSSIIKSDWSCCNSPVSSSKSLSLRAGVSSPRSTSAQVSSSSLSWSSYFFLPPSSSDELSSNKFCNSYWSSGPSEVYFF